MERRLAAILAADVVGYSAQVEVDEVATVERIARLTDEVLRPLIARHRGRLFKRMGDGFLVEFGSAVNAVACARAWQERTGRDAHAPRFRIGLHLGDVLVDETGDLLGDGVNIAARLERIAPEGGVALSSEVQAQVAGKIEGEFRCLGVQPLKNIRRPIEVWILRCDAEPGADGAETSASAARQRILDEVDRASVAVLPFSTVSADRSHDYLAVGIADQLVTALGQVPWFFVSSETASFAPALAGLPHAEIGRRLGVRYLVEGTMHRAGERLRISVRLAEAASGRQLWSQRFDGTVEEIFELQDLIARQVIGQIEPRLRNLEIRRSHAMHGNLSAYHFYLQAQPLIRSMTPADHAEARRLLENALRQNPEHAAAHGLIAWLTTLGLPQGADGDLEQGVFHARQAIALGALDCEALSTGGYALGFLERAFDLGLAHLREALVLNPNSARTHDFLGWLLLYVGRAGEALEAFDHSLELSPIDEFAFRALTGRAFALLFLGRPAEAVETARRAHAANPHFTVCHRVLATALVATGDLPGAREVVADLLAHYPGLTVARFARDTRFSEPESRELLLEGLRRAGLPPG